jgi:DNA-binding response OmpR family regulator
MPRRPNPARNAPPAPATSAVMRVLIAMADRKAGARVARLVSESIPGILCGQVSGAAEARSAIAEAAPDLAVIDCQLPDGSGFELAQQLGIRGDCGTILLSSEATFDHAAAAMRAGAAELLRSPVDEQELSRAISSVLARTRMARRREERIRRLSHLCRLLNDSRREVTGQVSGLCGDMINAFQEMAEQVSQITLAAEFSGLIRQELDVETLLRTGLEYILAKCGSTNAAVFLPAGAHEFSLGAYVNYDCPKDALDMMLEHLVGIISPRMQDEEGLKVLSDEHELGDFLGDDAHWLAECSAVMFSCRHEGECLAVVMLFRDRRNPFSETALSTLQVVSQVFAQQLARVVRVHHRHLPKNQWGMLADDGDDDLDLAA